ncbi:MAG: polyprenyl synthetase family protein [Flavobacteriales bacterium]|nr:polyprenyl synthetase family protein [Flavobacteriales bacterium]
MAELNKIKKPIEREMNEFDTRFRQSMKSSAPLLDKITHYIVKRKGKQMRPMFVFLSAHITGGATEATYRAGILIELLHTATLVHDDVVDDSNERRGFFSINALWKNKIAVLVGDFLLSRGLLLATQHKDFRLLEIVSEAVRLMSEGELLQIEKARRLDIEEPIYFEIIRRKTASLIASCCACGASSAGADEETVQLMYLFGEKIGIAFQIKDDLFDYENSSIIGKPTGIDIKEQKMTLPLIYALNHASSTERKHIINIVKNNNNDPQKVKEVIDFVSKSGGIPYAEKKMIEYQKAALEMLDRFPDSVYKQSLIDLVEFTTKRKY